MGLRAGLRRWNADLHAPQLYSNTKIECHKGEPAQDHEIPKSGKGGTSGPGTFKYFKQKNVTHTLRFGKGNTHIPRHTAPPSIGKGNGKGDAAAGSGAASSTA